MTPTADLNQTALAAAKEVREVEFSREDAVAALAQPASGEGWRTIDSAPKDGTRFLALQRDRHFDCWWCDKGYGEAYWMDEADSEPNPTHWMPLPTSPREAEGGSVMVEHDRQILERALGILHLMAVERVGWRQVIFGRWYYPDEPLRNDAANLLRSIGYKAMLPYHTRHVGDE